jgi:hypothetical protein
VPVLGAVINKQKQAMGRETRYQPIEKCLGLGIDPVKALYEKA